VILPRNWLAPRHFGRRWPLSLQHFPLSTVAFVIVRDRTRRRLADAVVGAVGPVLAGVPVYDAKTMNDRLSDSVGLQRIAATAMRGLALVAFLLAATGLYGVLAYLVARRTHGLGIRLALGAQPKNVIGMLRTSPHIAALERIRWWRCGRTSTVISSGARNPCCLYREAKDSSLRSE